MWGPANVLSDETLSSDQQGLTPRVLQRLFDRISEVKTYSFHFQAD
jgi:kinesin family protein 15